jgi:hypothetical protein
MKWVGCGLLVFMLALPALWAEDKPKDKDEKKEATAKERYDTLVKDVNSQRNAILAEARKAKGDEQQKLFEKYSAVGKEFGEKFYKLAEEDSKGAVGQDALFWIVQNAAGSPVYEKASEKAMALIEEMPLKDLNTRLNRMQANPVLVDAVLKRAEKEDKDPAAGDLVAWVATRGYYLPAGQKAIDRLIEKYPDNPSVGRAIATIGRSGNPNAETKLRDILEKSDKPKVKAAAALEIGRMFASKSDKLADDPTEADKAAAEGDKYLATAIELYGKDDKVAKEREDAEGELRALRTLRVGKPAPEIKAGDLDGKEFKLSDYRGKVVLLDFWGNW